MRRRGYPAESINSFCDAIGVTRRGNENYINFGVLENEVRKFLDVNAPRTMAVLDPVELIIEGSEEQILNVPLFPKEEQRGSRPIKFSNRIWVERSDIKLKDQKGFYGIAPQKVVGLKYASTIFIKEVKEVDGVITQVIAEIDQTVLISLFRKRSLTLI
jgi:glutaminyl-tRNA synthetase